MIDTYCIDCDDYLADKNDDDENDDHYGNDDVKQQRQMVMPGKVILQQIKTYIETRNLGDIQTQLFQLNPPNCN